MRRVAVTTVDNPYDPFDQYPEWSAYDDRKGYGTSSMMARLTGKLENLSEHLHHLAVEEAIDEMVEFNLLGLWVKVVRESDDSPTVREGV